MPKKNDLPPLYATISALGNLFCVVKAATRDRAEATSGCHDGVFDPYRGSGIPLIDFRTCYAMDKALESVCGVAEATVFCDNSDRRLYPTLEKYIEQCRAAGCTIGEL